MLIYKTVLFLIIPFSVVTLSKWYNVCNFVRSQNERIHRKMSKKKTQEQILNFISARWFSSSLNKICLYNRVVLPTAVSNIFLWRLISSCQHYFLHCWNWNDCKILLSRFLLTFLRYGRSNWIRMIFSPFLNKKMLEK